MMKVAIMPVLTLHGTTSYHAIAGHKQSAGVTAGAALDALTAQLPADETGTLIIVQTFRPDTFFTAAHQQRLADLMARWRSAHAHETSLPVHEQAELETLIDLELDAATRRAAALADTAQL